MEKSRKKRNISEDYFRFKTEKCCLIWKEGYIKIALEIEGGNYDEI